MIDLGELRPQTLVDPLPAGGSPRRRWRCRIRVICLVLSVLACGVLRGSAAAVPPLQQIFQIQLAWGWYQADDQSVYLLTQNRELSAFRLTDGSLRWRTALPGAPDFMQVFGDGLYVYLSAQGYGACSDLVRVDPDTGALSWRRSGGIVGRLQDHSRVLLTRGGFCTGDTVDQGELLDLVDPDTGAVENTITVRPGEQWTLQPADDTIVIWDMGGRWSSVTFARARS